MLLDRKRVKFWQKMVFGFMAFLMAGFLVMLPGVLQRLRRPQSTSSAVEQLKKAITKYKTASRRPTPATPRPGPRWARTTPCSPTSRRGLERAEGRLAAGHRCLQDGRRDPAGAEGRRRSSRSGSTSSSSSPSVYLNLQDYAGGDRRLRRHHRLHAEGRAGLLRPGHDRHQRGRQEHRDAGVHQVPGARPDVAGRRPGQGWIKQNTPKSHAEPVSEVGRPDHRGGPVAMSELFERAPASASTRTSASSTSPARSTSTRRRSFKESLLDAGRRRAQATRRRPQRRDVHRLHRARRAHRRRAPAARRRRGHGARRHDAAGDAGAAITGLDRVFTIHATRDEALAALA